MMTPGHIVSMYVTTSGQTGPQLGSDEKEIILLVYAVIDSASSKVVDLQQYLVRPVGEFGILSAPATTTPAIAATAHNAEPDASAINAASSTLAPNSSSITSNNNSASSMTSQPDEAARDAAASSPSSAGNSEPNANAGSLVAVVPTASPSGATPVVAQNAPAPGPEHNITEAMLKMAGRPLGECIEQYDHHLRHTLAIDPDAPNFRLLTDGALPLRQCLHPEACSKNIALPAYYCRYNDVRKEYVRYRSADLSRALVAVKDAKNLANMPALPTMPTSIAEMMQQLEIPTSTEVDPNYFSNESRDMITLIQHLISVGHKFDAVESINIILEPGLCSIDDEIDGQCIVRARGLPWQSSDQDIANFFRGLNVAKGGVALCLSVQGRRNGEAMVRFTSQEHRDMALKRHKHHIGNRYIEVYRASGEDFLNVAGGASNEAQTFLSRGATVIIRMRGLPYDCTAKQVLEFFANGNEPCSVLDAADGILFVKKPDGRATGDAFVLFASDDDAPKALSRHRESIGQRYIELFRSTTAEVQQVLNRSMDPKTYEPPPPPLIAQLPPVQMPLLPQHVITSGTSKSCIRLRGLPYEARVEHILHFLEDFANHIIYQGVHMVYNAQGQPSGEAFIQMNSEEAARASAQLKHNKYMVFGKKYRYIEVFQCSGDDMNLVLNGGLHSPANANAKPALLSPGGSMLASPYASYAPFSPAGPPPAPPSSGVLHATRLAHHSLHSPPHHHPAHGHPHHHPHPHPHPASLSHHPQSHAHHTHAHQPHHQPPPPHSMPAHHHLPSPPHPHHHPHHHPAGAAAFYPPPILYWGYPSPPVSPTAYYGPPTAPSSATSPPASSTTSPAMLASPPAAHLHPHHQHQAHLAAHSLHSFPPHAHLPPTAAHHAMQHHHQQTSPLPPALSLAQHQHHQHQQHLLHSQQHLHQPPHHHLQPPHHLAGPTAAHRRHQQPYQHPSHHQHLVQHPAYMGLAIAHQQPPPAFDSPELSPADAAHYNSRLTPPPPPACNGHLNAAVAPWTPRNGMPRAECATDAEDDDGDEDDDYESDDGDADVSEYAECNGAGSTDGDVPDNGWTDEANDAGPSKESPPAGKSVDEQASAIDAQSAADATPSMTGSRLVEVAKTAIVSSPAAAGNRPNQYVELFIA